MSSAHLLVFAIVVVAAKGTPMALGNFDFDAQYTENVESCCSTTQQSCTSDSYAASFDVAQSDAASCGGCGGCSDCVQLVIAKSDEGCDSSGYSISAMITLADGISDSSISAAFRSAAQCDSCKNMDTCIERVLIIAHACSLVMDRWISGFGSYFFDMCMCMTKITACHKSSGCSAIDFKLAFFGSDESAICKSSFLSGTGYSKCYSGKYDNCNEVSTYYGVSECSVKKSFLGYASGYTRGEDWKCLNGVRRVLFTEVEKMSCCCSRGYESLKKEDMVNMVKSVITIAGAIGNTYQNGLGDEMVSQILNYCNGAMKKCGWGECNQYRSDILILIRDCYKYEYNFKSLLRRECTRIDKYDTIVVIKVEEQNKTESKTIKEKQSNSKTVKKQESGKKIEEKSEKKQIDKSEHDERQSRQSQIVKTYQVQAVKEENEENEDESCEEYCCCIDDCPCKRHNCKKNCNNGGHKKCDCNNKSPKPCEPKEKAKKPSC